NVPELLQLPDNITDPLPASKVADGPLTKFPETTSAPEPEAYVAPAPVLVNVAVTVIVPVPAVNAALLVSDPRIVTAPAPPLNAPDTLVRLFLIRIMPAPALNVPSLSRDPRTPTLSVPALKVAPEMLERLPSICSPSSPFPALNTAEAPELVRLPPIVISPVPMWKVPLFTKC